MDEEFKELEALFALVTPTAAAFPPTPAISQVTPRTTCVPVAAIQQLTPVAGVAVLEESPAADVADMSWIATPVTECFIPAAKVSILEYGLTPY